MIRDKVKYDDGYIKNQLKSFKLVDIKENYQEIIDQAIKEKLGYKEFLIKLIEIEEEGKKRRLAERLTLRAGFDSKVKNTHQKLINHKYYGGVTMANVKKQDYEYIANIFNESGDKAAQEYIATTYGNKAPRGVISRIELKKLQALNMMK